MVASPELLWQKSAMHFSRSLLFCTAFLMAGLINFARAESTSGAGAELPHAAAQRPLNVLLIVIDTLAARHLGTYSPAGAPTPNIDTLASKGARFERAYSVSSWTKPGLASILTSKMPSRHGVTAMRDKLGQEHRTLPEILQERGYRTAAFVSHTILGKRSGFAQGFETYEQLNRDGNPHHVVTSPLVSNRALEWLDSRSTAERAPFFLVLHYFDPHFRYRDHAEFDYTAGYTGPLRSGMSLERLMAHRSKFSAADTAFLKNLFREEVSFTDLHIGRVLSHLAERKLESDTLIVLTADHGEEFLEHGSLGHTQTLFEEITNIPLIVALPGRVPVARYGDLVNQLDILPTIVSFCGAANAASEKAIEGRDLGPHLLGAAALPSRPLFAEVAYRKVSNAGEISPHLAAVWDGNHKFIVDKQRKREMLFDLQTDPEERHNLIATVPDTAARLRSLLSELEGNANSQKPGDHTEFSDDQIEQLRSLGYL